MHSIFRSSSRSLSLHGRRWLSAAPHAPSPLTVLTEEEVLLKDAAAAFAKTHIAPRVRAMDAAGVMDASIIRGLFDGGFMGIEVPQKYGGTGSNFLSACLVIEELAKVDASVAVLCDVQNTLVNNVFKIWGSEEMKAAIYPRLAGDTVGSFCLSEAGSGSDAFALKTRADKSGDIYTINGKYWSQKH